MHVRAAVLAAVLLAACSSSPPRGGGACAFPAAVSGTATTYVGTSAGACMFPAGQRFYAAVSPAVYDGSAACGTCLEVTGAAGPVTLQVTDLCPECAPTQLDLSPDAWDAVTGVSPGLEPISWRRVECADPGPIRFVAVTGVNPWWIGVVVQDHRYPIAAVELLPAGATAWVRLARDPANQWIGAAPGGGGATPLAVRATAPRPRARARGAAPTRSGS